MCSEHKGGLAPNQDRECCWQDSSQGFWPSQGSAPSLWILLHSSYLSSLAPLSRRVYSHTVNNMLWTCTSITCVFSNNWEDLMPGRKSVLFLCPEVPALCYAHRTIQAVPVSHGQLEWLLYNFFFLTFQSYFTCKLLSLRNDYSSPKQAIHSGKHVSKTQ